MKKYTITRIEKKEQEIQQETYTYMDITYDFGGTAEKNGLQ